MIHKATVNSICSSLSLYIGKAPVDCLKFYGEAISGCSGVRFLIPKEMQLQ
jgi:hypothetical protein